MKVIHLWQDYSPNLFDKSHPLCLAHDVCSQVACQAFVDNGATPLPRTYYVRKRSPAETNSNSLISRAIRRLRRPLDAARFARLAKRRIDAFDPDVVHIHFGTTAAALERLSALPQLPMIVSFYGVDVSQALHDPAILRAYRSIFKRASVLHVLCDEARDRLIAAGCPSEKIRIANLPANIEKIPDIGVEATEHTRFLIPARFVEKKGHVVLLNAFKGLLRDGKQVSLTCFGYGPTAWLERMVSDMGLAGAVDIVNNGQSANFTAEYIDVLRRHDIVLAPSIQSAAGDDEGGPALTLVMAQAAGKPVIVSDFPGAERSVTDGQEGLIVPAGEVAALQQAMTRMAGNPERWEEFGRAGRVRVIAEFSESAYWAKLREWYRTAAQAGQ